MKHFNFLNLALQILRGKAVSITKGCLQLMLPVFLFL